MTPQRKDLMPLSLLPAQLERKEWARMLVTASGKPLTPRILMNIEEAGHEQEPGEELTHQVSLVIDCSNSMSRKDKMPQARRGALQFAREALRKGYLVSLIGFASDAMQLRGPVESLEEIRQVLAGMKAGKGSTNMAVAIRLARGQLSHAHGERVMCLVTDGQPDSEKEALAEAEAAKQLGMEIMTIGTDDAKKAFLEQLASCHELSAKVSSHELEQGMVNMAKRLPLLPAPKRIGTTTPSLPQV
jgi:Mg-chelatase subunit ChlD